MAIEKRIREFSEDVLTDLWVTDPRRFRMFYIAPPFAAVREDLAVVQRNKGPVFPFRPSGVRGGAALAHANLIALSRNRLELQRIFEEIHSLVPMGILSVRDPTVSMVWPDLQ